MAAPYLVALFHTGGLTLTGGNDAALVWADSAEQARSMASAALSGDVPAAAWDNADVFEITSGTELEGWVFTINLTDNQAPFTLISVSVTGTNGQDIDAIGTALATALNATVINGAAYVGASNVLTIVQTTDNMGDWFIEMKSTPPANLSYPFATYFRDPAQHVTGMFGAITAAGAAGIARTVTLVDVKPALYSVMKLEPFAV